jgi:uncharacterized protein (DUF1697 family)
MKYVALFRGINVGGKNLVKMDMLRQLFQELGCFHVKTYIQSGNVVFESDLKEASLKDVIQTKFVEQFGFESNVVLRHIEELTTLINQLPFLTEEIAEAEAADTDVEHLYIYFLDESPDQAQVDEICNSYEGPDILRMGERELYLLCYPSIRKSKLGVRMAKVFPLATVRNWNTVNKLYDIMKTIEG